MIKKHNHQYTQIAGLAAKPPSPILQWVAMLHVLFNIKGYFLSITHKPTRSSILVGLIYMLTLVWGFLYSAPLIAQKINTTQYTVEDGLPSSNIYQILEDQAGFIWVATDKGLAKFNGYTFENYTIQDGLPSNDVWGLKQDKKGRIWLSTFNKITYFENNKFHTFSLVDSLKLQTPMLQEYWIGEEEVYVLANENNTNYFVELNLQDSTQHLIRKNFEYTGYLGYYNNRKWFVHFTTDGFPYIYYVADGHKEEIFFTNIEVSASSVANRKFLIRGEFIYFFSAGAVWQFDFQKIKEIPIEPILGSGVIIEDVFPTNGPSQKIILLKTNKGYKILDHNLEVLPLLNGTDNFYKSVFEDSKGNIWLSATNGLFLITANNRHSQYYSLSNDINNNNCTAVLVDSTNTIWAANQKNVLWKIQNNQLEQVQLLQNKFTSIPLKYLLQWKNRLLAAGDFGIFVLPANPFTQEMIEAVPYKKNINSPSTYDLSKGNFLPFPIKEINIHNNSIVTSQWSGVSKIYIDEDTLSREASFSGRTYSCEIDAKNQMWLGRKNGLWLAKGDKLENLGEKFPLLRYPINDLKIDQQDNIWIATDGFGILYFNRETVFVIEESKNNTPNQLFIDEGNTVWAATNRGVSKISISNATTLLDYTYQQYTSTHGLIANEVNQVIVKDSILYAATNAGLSTINLSKIVDQSAPVLYIEGVKSNGTNVSVKSSIECSYQENNIVIEYVSLSYKSKGKIDYEYQMIGIDTSWQSTTSLTREYPQLDPGAYTFNIRAKDINGVYSSTQSIQIIIHPPLWGTVWFRLATLLVLGLGIGGVFRWKVQSIRRQEAEKTRINKKFSELELQALRSRLNPHFIFNSMNAIQNYVYTKDKRVAGKYIVQFSRLMRLFLNASYEKFNFLDKEVEILERYIELEKMRFIDKFDYQIIIDKTLPVGKIKIPSLILQPYVENAINHGLVNRVSKGNLYLRIHQKNDVLICEIEDDGIGQVAAKKIKQQSLKKHQPRGMALVAERQRVLMENNNIDIKIEMIDLYNKKGVACGTKVVVQIPMQDFKEIK